MGEKRKGAKEIIHGYLFQIKMARYSNNNNRRKGQWPIRNVAGGTSQLVLWLRVRLPMKGTQV